MPAEQFEHRGAPPVLNEPGAHNKQASLELPPLALKNVPAEQFEQRGAPPVLNEPGAHSVHTSLELPRLLLKNLPAEQFVHSGAPLVLNEPGPQGRHAAGVPPVSGLNVPASHLRQEGAPAKL